MHVQECVVRLLKVCNRNVYMLMKFITIRTIEPHLSQPGVSINVDTWSKVDIMKQIANPLMLEPQQIQIAKGVEKLDTLRNLSRCRITRRPQSHSKETGVRCEQHFVVPLIRMRISHRLNMTIVLTALTCRSSQPPPPPRAALVARSEEERSVVCRAS